MILASIGYTRGVARRGGWRRAGSKRSFRYLDARGNRISDPAKLARIESLVIPPAWKDVWISPRRGAKLQATGVDAAGRRQYLYHPEFRAQQEQAKFDKLVRFAERLPDFRMAMGEHMMLDSDERERVCAVAVRLINLAWFRVGSDRYAKTSRTHGVTTLTKRHVTVRGSRVTFRFRAKHKVQVRTSLVDAELAEAIRALLAQPGSSRLFRYGSNGNSCLLTGAVLNDYIREHMGAEFTAKDFRTWGASSIAFEEMVRRYRKHGKVKLKSVIEPVAEALGNTAAISRKSYVHPALIEAARDAGAIGERSLPRASKYLSAAERGLIEFLDALDEKAEAAAKAA
jgi:DNA topoisomerase-1